MDTDTDDLAANGFGNCITRDGQGSASANQPMNGFRHTGVGNGQASTDYAALGQVQAGVGLNWTTAGGSADALTATYTPALTALVDGQLCCLRAANANATTTPTFAPNGLTAHTITKLGGVALLAGDIAGNLAEIVLRYNLANTRWELLEPQNLPFNPQVSNTNWVVAGGTHDALTATYSPAITSLYDGILCFVRAGAANTTTTPTFAPNGLTAEPITRAGGVALRVGDIPGNLAEIILRYNLANTRWELLNPGAVVGRVVVQVFTSTSTYTPTAGMLYCTAELVGSGGAGGGASNGGAGNISVGGGGGAGGYTRKTFTAATIGASQTVTIGAAGTGVSGGTGGTGGQVTFGSLLTANGGSGGTASANQTTSVIQGGASGGAASGGDFSMSGQTGYDGWGFVATNGLCSGGAGGNSVFPGAGTPAMGGPGSDLAGVSAVGFGSGGGGSFNNQNSTSTAGGSGSKGIVIVTEFVS